MADKDVREFCGQRRKHAVQADTTLYRAGQAAAGGSVRLHRGQASFPVCAAEELYNRIKGRYNAVLTHRDLTRGSDIKERTGDKS